MSISQAFEEYGRGSKAFAEIEHEWLRCIQDQHIPLYAKLFVAGRMAGKSDKEIEDKILNGLEESNKDVKNDSDIDKECIEVILEVWNATIEDAIKPAKQLADKIADVEKEFKKFAKLEKKGMDLNNGVIGFRHDRWIMTIERDCSLKDIKEQGLVHTFKDKKNLLFDAYVTTDDFMYLKMFNAQETTTLPDINKYVLGKIHTYITDKGEELSLIGAQAGQKTNHYRNLGRFMLESVDTETDRILGVKDKPDDTRIKDYQVLYESPKCIKHKEQYSSREWLIGKKPVEYED